MKIELFWCSVEQSDGAPMGAPMGSQWGEIGVTNLSDVCFRFLICVVFPKGVLGIILFPFSEDNNQGA